VYSTDVSESEVGKTRYGTVRGNFGPFTCCWVIRTLCRALPSAV